MTPLVGRSEELELLANTFERAIRDSRAHVVTIYGEPGVGKSRLAGEFVSGLEGATVLGGRCLPTARDHVLAAGRDGQVSSRHLR